MKRVLIFLLLLATTLGFGQTLDELTRLGEGRSRRESSNNEDWLGSNVDFRFIRPGESLTLADVKGPGTIRRIWLTILPSEPGYSRLMTIRIYWDGEKEPSVECPLGDFFGVGHGMDVPFESQPVRASADGKARSCVWPMPFRKSARITVTNDGTEATWGFYYLVDWEEGKVAKDAPYFHASYRQATTTDPAPFVIADIEGRGHYVGTVLSVRTNSGGWWGEGDDFFWIDGETVPSLRGSGLEDYFGEAWGLRKADGLYSGASAYEGGYPGARTTAYRWHIPDPVRFRKSLRVAIEHEGVEPGKEGNNNARVDDYSAAAFWYQTGRHKPYPPLPKGHDRLPYDFRRMTQGESVVDVAKASAGKLVAGKANGLSKNGELDWAATGPGDTLTIPFEVAEDGSYHMLLLLTNRWDGATFEVLVDGKSVWGKLDSFDWGFSPFHETALPVQSLKAGRHELTFRVVGRNPDANGFWLGLDGFVVQRSGKG